MLGLDIFQLALLRPRQAPADSLRHPTMTCSWRLGRISGTETRNKVGEIPLHLQLLKAHLIERQHKLVNGTYVTNESQIPR